MSICFCVVTKCLPGRSGWIKVYGEFWDIEKDEGRTGSGELGKGKGKERGEKEGKGEKKLCKSKKEGRIVK